MGKLEPAGDGEFNYMPSTGAEREAAELAADKFNARQNIYRMSAFAALAFWRQATPRAKEALHDLKEAYEASKRTTPWPGWEAIPKPDDCAYLPYQLAGIQYAARRRHSLIGDAPGLGKTIQAIGLANYVGARRVLVICPGNVRINWDRQIRRWSTIEDLHTYPILKSRDGVSPYAHYVVTSYELARTDSIRDALATGRFDMLVLDEAHYLKTPDARRTRAVFGGREYQYALGEDGSVQGHYVELAGLAASASRVVALTGTPLPNRPRECYTLARHLCWDSIDWASEENFSYRYNPRGFPGDREVAGRLTELQVRLRANFMIRRLKEDVLKDLPPKRYELCYVEENGAIRRALQRERLLDISIDDIENPHFKMFGEVSTVRRMMGEAMVPRIVEHVKMLLDGGVEKLVLFAHHRSVMDELQKRLEQYGVCMIRGGMTPLAKQAAIDTFIRDPKKRIFEAQINVGGVGIDGLQQVASHTVLAEASWVPGENDQAIDRLHRHGQRGSVLAQFLVASGSISEMIFARTIEKNQTIHQTLDEDL